MEKSRCNPRLKVSPTKVARLYAAANLHEVERKDAEVILSAIEAGDFQRAKTLCDWFARPEFGSAIAYYRRKQFTALITKVPFTGSNHLRKRRAATDFLAAEARCRRTNRKLRHYQKHPNRMPEVQRVVLTRAREWVHRVLGVLSEGKLERIIALSRPGKGVSIGTRNRFRVSLPFKLGDTDLTSTSRALPYARMLVEGSVPWLRLHAVVDWAARTYQVPYTTATGNRITYVPKDARTLRTIAIEPALNVCLQLGVHSYMADRLKSFGNGIDDQTRNQMLARQGSLTPLGASLCTIDLSQASDSVSIELVRWLLPSDWFGLLDDLRCESGVVEGSPIVYEKFSSMGNGFTFALETLIFWALTQAVNSLTGGEVSSCYGDDIICEDKSALLLVEVLNWCGFQINLDKSYFVGPFRESCGADWHYGWRVTPHYVRTPVFRCTDVYSLLNRFDPVFQIGPLREYLLTCHREMEPVLFGLENEDTGSCLFTSFAYCKGGGRLRFHADWQTVTFKGWVFEPISERVPVWSAYAAALKGSQGTDSLYQLRGRGEFRLRNLTPGVPRDLARMNSE